MQSPRQGLWLAALSTLCLLVRVCSAQTAEHPPASESPSSPLPANPSLPQPVSPVQDNQEDGSVTNPDVGWFVGAGAGLARPSLRRLATAQNTAATFLGRLDSFNLDWSVSPEATVGFRFDGGATLTASYRNLSSQGTVRGPAALDPIYRFLFSGQMVPGYLAFPGDTVDREMHGRLEEHWVDLDFTSGEYTLSEEDGLPATASWRWFAGARLASLTADIDTQDRFGLGVRSAADPSQSLGTLPLTAEQRAFHRTLGAGPHLGVQGSWVFGPRGVSLFGKVDGGALVTANQQEYELSASTTVPGALTGGDPMALNMRPVSGSDRGPGVLPTLSLQAGLDWSLPWRRACLGLSAGYEVDAWWFLVTGDAAKDSALFSEIDRLNHGPFLRCHVEY